MPFSLTTHVYSRRGSSPPVLTKLQPYVRLGQEGEVPLYIQNGCVYSEGGELIEKPPSWLLEQVKYLTDTVREEVGISDDWLGKRGNQNLIAQEGKGANK